MIDQHIKADVRFASLAIFAYAVLVLTVLPSSDFPRMLGTAAVLVTAVALVARGTHDAPPPSFSVLIVSFVGAATLVMPGFQAMGGRNGPPLPIGFLGSQAVSLLWATLIWRETSRPRSRVNLRDALRFALFGAVGLSVIASIPIALMLLSDPSKSRPYLLVYPAYFLGAFAAAIVYWLFRRIAHRPLGQYIIGGLGGTFMYTAVAPIVYLSKGEAIRPGELLGLGIVCGFLVGPPVALSANDAAAS